jgi:hypothetical protein
VSKDIELSTPALVKWAAGIIAALLIAYATDFPRVVYAQGERITRVETRVDAISEQLTRIEHKLDRALGLEP